MIRILAFGLLALTACAPTVPDSGAGSIDAFGTTASGNLTEGQSSFDPSQSVAPPPPTEVSIAPPQGATRYECDTGQTIFADTSNRRATVTFGNGNSVAMSRVQGAAVDGATFAGGGWIWFVSGDRAVLTEQGGQANCRVSAL